MNHYNIEIKSNPKSDGKTYPSLEEYIDPAMKIIIDKDIAPRTMIQSFDIRALKRLSKALFHATNAKLWRSQKKMRCARRASLRTLREIIGSM